VYVAALRDARFRLAGDHLRTEDRRGFHVIHVHDVEVGLLEELLLGIAEQAAESSVDAQEAPADREKCDG